MAARCAPASSNWTTWFERDFAPVMLDDIFIGIGSFFKICDAEWLLILNLLHK